MREKVFAIGNDYWVENDAGERAFKVDGNAALLGLFQGFRMTRLPDPEPSAGGDEVMFA